MSQLKMNWLEMACAEVQCAPSNPSLLRSPSHAGEAEKDACRPGYGSSPNMETPSKSLGGHHHRDGCLSLASAGTLVSSPRTDFAVTGNQHEPEVSGVVDREKSRFNSSPHGWEVPNRGLDNRSRTWSRYGYKRPYPLPKLDSSKDWSRSGRELLEGRIDRYSGVSGREVGFFDVVSGHGRENIRNDYKGRERALQSGVLSYSPANSFYSRDSRSFSFGSEVSRSGSPSHYHSPLQSFLSYDSDLDTSLISSKKRPRLTWGQGLAKYEKERTGNNISAAKKSEEGSNFAGGLHAGGSYASTLPEFTSQPRNAIFWSEDGHPHQESCVNGSIHSCQQHSGSHESIVMSNVNTADLSNLPEVCLGDVMVLNSTGQSIGAEDALIGTPELDCPLLQYMLSFIDKYKQGQSSLSEDVLTQHVEKVELEVDRLEKELINLEKKSQELYIYPETNVGAILKSSEHVLLEPSNSGIKESPGRSLTLLMDITSMDAVGNEELGLVTSAKHAVQGVCDPSAEEVLQGVQQQMNA